MTKADRRTRVVIVAFVLSCGILWLSASAVALAQLLPPVKSDSPPGSSTTERLDAVRREAAEALSRHVHPDLPGRAELLAIATAALTALGALQWRIHTVQLARQEDYQQAQRDQQEAMTSRQDRQGEEVRALRTSHDGLSNVVSGIAGRLDAERDWLHERLDSIGKATDDLRRDTSDLAAMTNRRRGGDV